MLNAANGVSTLLMRGEGIKEPNWLAGKNYESGDDDLENIVLVLRSGCAGSTEFVIGDVRRYEER